MIEIATLADLQAINTDLRGHYCLVADIDASETKNWDGGKGFAPIGSVSEPFAGVLDGGGHAIRNLHINRGWEDDVGLLRVLGRSGKVRNLTLVDAKVSGNKFVGSLSGASRGSISGCGTSGEVSGNERSVGGLVGLNLGSIRECRASNEVSGAEKFVGGLAGSNSGSITQCQASGEVSGKHAVGGLVGCNDGSITECQARGRVLGHDRFAGGLAGLSRGDIADSQASGEVLGNGHVGGLVGCNEDDIARCHASGKVTGNRLVGGLVGFDKATVTDSYWDTETTGQQDSRGNGEGRTSFEMKQRATFVDWDFQSVWQIKEGESYPRLRCFADKDDSGVFGQ
ncbi:MAG: hypothetical protein HZC54_03085 [Verrucomicrobia bacterium]|nr:hypothetical protein [Verrucomicrobiota bacterium]